MLAQAGLQEECDVGKVDRPCYITDPEALLIYLFADGSRTLSTFVYSNLDVHNSTVRLSHTNNIG
jgi:hypothetical protein